MLMVMQKEIEVQQEQKEHITEIPLDFADFVRRVELNVEKSLLSRRNRQVLREKIKENWLFRSKIIPPNFAKIGKQNQSRSPNFFLSPNSAHHSSQTCPVTEHEISPTAFECSPQGSKQNKLSRAECKTSCGVRKVGSYNRIKSSWKLQFRRDELNVLQYQRKSDEQLPDTIDPSSSQKSFKVRKVHRKFEEIKHQSCQNYRNKHSTQERSYNAVNGSYKVFESGSMYRTKSPQ